MPGKSNSKGDLRTLPSVDAVLQTSTAIDMTRELGYERTLSIVKTAIARLRFEIETNETGGREFANVTIDNYLREAAERESRLRLRKVINATGIIIHTNLGRSPLPAVALDAISAVSGYCNLEFDLATGERGRRG